MSEVKTHYRTCNLCEAMCGLEIQYQDREVLTIKGDKQDPFSRGHICPKAVALKDIFEDPDRLKYPVKKTENGWEEISWDAAYGEVVTRIQGIQQEHGKNAVGIYQGNPNVHNTGAMLFGAGFVKSLKTKNRFSATSTDQLPHHFAAYYMLGHFFLLPVPDIDRTDFLLILGANPMVSNGSIMTAPDIGHRLKAIQERDGKIIVIDPRKTQTAKKADQHIFVQPGKDVFLLLSIIQVIFKEGLVQLDRLGAYTVGVATLQEVVRPYTPEKTASITGIPAEITRTLALDFAKAEKAVCYGRLGVSTQEFGGLCQWLVNALNIITGNFDEEGGAMFTLPAIDNVAFLAQKGSLGSHGRWKSRVSGQKEFSGELPNSVMAEEILTPGEGQIKAMVTVAGNPILSTPNGQQLDEAFSKLEFMLAIDIYINETTRHADIILPPTTGLECSHYDTVFHTLAIRNTSKYSEALFEKEDKQRHTHEILQELTSRLSGKLNNNFTPEMMLTGGMQMGPHAKDGLSFDKVKKEPHGIDLGPLTSVFPNRLFTKDKILQLAPKVFLEDMARVQVIFETTHKDDTFPFQLIGRRLLRSNNSWMHNSYRLVKGGNACTALIHPEDAATLGLKDGEMVTIASRVNSVKIACEISDEVMRGVVSIPHGFGHDKEGIRLSIAQAHAGVSINDLTDEKCQDVLTGNAVLNGVPVGIVVCD